MNNIIISGSQLDTAQKSGITLAQAFLNADILVLFDNSASMANQDAPDNMTRREYAEQQLTHIQGQHPGKVALICFGAYVEYSPSGTILNVGGSTALHKALDFAKVADDTGLKIILVSDGEPDNREMALSVARGYKSKIDVIYCGNESGSGLQFLQKLAKVTGGEFHKSQSLDEITHLLEG